MAASVADSEGMVVEVVPMEVFPTVDLLVHNQTGLEVHDQSITIDIYCNRSDSEVQPKTNPLGMQSRERFSYMRKVFFEWHPCQPLIAKFQDEIMTLPLAGIEAILSSDDLQATSEDAICVFVVNKLREILMCDDLDHNLASKLVIEALFFKSEAFQTARMALWLAASSERLRYDYDNFYSLKTFFDPAKRRGWPMEEFDRLRSKHVSLVNQVMNPCGFFHVNNNDTVPADLDVTFEISHLAKNRGF
ncbi:hypothetical protein ZIOFF_067722 [Zingiber officinale]|uniref:Uncharacterized protein n=1 Tax=Zingiber officinale TaxID=94328 RepID=A0A8J5CFZ4_ZINOF|nr:hypothetical protein ZIOFF_067722 [Zingiber officinale]